MWEEQFKWLLSIKKHSMVRQTKLSLVAGHFYLNLRLVGQSKVSAGLPQSVNNIPPFNLEHKPSIMCHESKAKFPVQY